MNCPTCENTALVMSERGGVEIDYCPKCRGVWLDRGELDKIVQKAMAEDSASGPARGGPPTMTNAAPAAPGYAPPPPTQPYPPGYNPNQDSKFGYSYGQAKRKSVWKDLFDF